MEVVSFHCGEQQKSDPCAPHLGCVSGKLETTQTKRKMMKARFTIALALLLGWGVQQSYAQLSKEQRKERAALMKEAKSALDAKTDKAARKAAKRMIKEGWKTAPGALPIDRQLDRSYKMQYMYDENQFPKYLMGEAMSTASNYDAAKMQAMELAKQNLAGQIQTEVTALVENSLANSQMQAEEAASITKSVSAGKNLISQSIGRVVPVVEVYRDLKNKNKEVRVVIAYNAEMAKAAARKAVEQSLGEQAEKLHGKLDQLLK